MTAATVLTLTTTPPPRWGRALAIAAVAHGAALALLASFVAAPVRAPEPPVMTIELPPLPPPAAAAQQSAQAAPAQQPPATPDVAPVEAPQVRTSIPPDGVTVPPKTAPQPQVAPAAPTVPAATAPRPAPAAPAPAVASRAAAADSSIGDDPRAKKAAANYYRMLMEYLARRKEYPAEARQARQQGVVTVRFTVDRGGNVSAEAIKRGSGFAVLDAATLRLMRRVSPMPPIPASMGRDSITIALPIEYSLSTK